MITSISILMSKLGKKQTQGPVFKSKVLYHCSASLCVQIFVLSQDEIHSENPRLLELRQKWDCCWSKGAISGSPIYLLAKKLLKICRHPTWYFYIGTGTSLGTFGFNPKPSNMHILASWTPYKVAQNMQDLFMKRLETCI